jgi:hypothetical protein
LVLLCGAVRWFVLLGAAWRCLVVFDDAGGSWWRLVVLNSA